MEQTPTPSPVRKLRKIKRQALTGNSALPNQPITFGKPSKTVYTQSLNDKTEIAPKTNAENKIDLESSMANEKIDITDSSASEHKIDIESPIANEKNDIPVRDEILPQRINQNTPQNNNDGYFANSVPNQPIEGPDEYYADDYSTAAPETIADLVKNKTVRLLMLIACLFGAFVGYAIIPQNSASTGRGLDGVVLNPNVPSGRSRCGVADPQQGCVLYLMNPRNTEVAAKEFYTTAAKWTNRKLFMIETNNLHYGSTIIKPGYIAQINIPPL